ncbi:MAG: hypothetical protein HYY43_06485 [Deltaproteobacteria bacterium]|nr:hypothetical protein [Deltaproteobacteria bacterium]MBI2975218.1 hypothetical protein [Deltaproteobacteria bacterium]
MKHERQNMKSEIRKQGFIVLLASCILLLSACGEDNAVTGEDHGNIAASESGIILTQGEHEIGWGKAACFDCHNTENIHQTDRTGTGLNLEAIEELTKDGGLDSCATCHGTNGVE